MTTKILTGTYSAGYTLSPSFAGLLLTGSAYVGGVGVLASAAAKVTNEGRILAAAGAAGGAGHYQGGAGKIGIDLAAGGGVVNFNTIAGGMGGAGGVNSTYRNGYSGVRAARRLSFWPKAPSSTTPRSLEETAAKAVPGIILRAVAAPVAMLSNF